MKVNPWVIMIAIGIAAFVIVVNVLSRQDISTGDAASSRDAEKDHYYQARRAISAHLKSPSTAKFSNPLQDPSTGARVLKPGLWEAFGTVDSQNGYGAILRQRWRVIWDDSVAAPVYTEIGDQFWGDPKSGK